MGIFPIILQVEIIPGKNAVNLWCQHYLNDKTPNVVDQGIGKKFFFFSVYDTQTIVNG